MFFCIIVVSVVVEWRVLDASQRLAEMAQVLDALSAVYEWRVLDALQRLAEMAQVLDARERRQVELSAENIALTEANLSLTRSQAKPGCFTEFTVFAFHSILIL